ncbi:hypothetical protein VQ01_11395 [Tamlana sp. s12]|nr:hypothetical protein VQ01_11395 [Tamlana sp. s12]
MEKQLSSIVPSRNIPQLRFSEFDLDYKKVELKKVATFNPKSEELPESFIYIDLESVKNGLLSKEERINKSDAPSRAQRLLRKDDIIYQTVRPYQKNNYFFDKNVNDYVASTGYAQIRTKQVSEYLYQYLHTEKFVNKVLVRCTGTSYPAINSTDLSKISINIPNIPEQQKIAAFLTDVDDKITKLTKKKDLLEQYKKGVMQKIFNQELRFKDDNGNAFPKWRKGRIDEFGYFYYGKSAPKFSLSDDAPTPCVRYGELYSTYDEVIIDIKSYTNIEPSNLKFSKGGEVLVPRVGEDPLDFANCSYLPFPNIAIGEMISVYNTEENGLFITYYFNAKLREKFARVVEGANVSNLYFKYLEDIEVQIPSLDEQYKIVSFLTDITNKIKAVTTKIEKAQSFKKGLLQQMFV